MNLLKSWQRPKPAALLLAALLILPALFTPLATMGRILRPNAAVVPDDIMLGGILFRIGLVILGGIVLLLAGLPLWQRPSRADRPSPVPRWAIILLVLLLLLALGMRLFQLGSGLWFDEILTYMNYARLPMGELVSSYEDENQHFLFSIGAHLSFLIFGESAWALRLPAALFGVASIGALFYFGRTVSSDREGLLAAALLALSYHHVWFSQNARGYSGLLLWSIVASWLFIRALRESDNRLWLAYAASAALGMYTHMTMMFVIFGHLTYYGWTLWRRRGAAWPERWHGFFLGFSIGGFLTLLLYSLVLPHMFTAIANTVSVVEEWRNPLWTLLELVNGIMVGFSGFSGGLIAVGVVALIGALLLFGVGVVSYWRSDGYVLNLLFVPAVTGALITIAMGHHLWPRFFFFAFGFGALVVVRGVMRTGEWLSGRFRWPAARAAWVGTALCLLLILASGASSLFAYGPKQDYESARAYIEANAQPGDAVVVVDLTGHIYDNFYNLDWTVVESQAELTAVRAAASRTWMLYTFVPVLESVYPDVMADIEQNFNTVVIFPGSVGAGEIIVALAQ
ncbi:MAG: glycosyltransferase family 39 protein [Anaerolineales bacterium]|nr:glycosyltransferase family 39 protein [Anaerolineales bacterium]